jgi:hypothetical protein
MTGEDTANRIASELLFGGSQLLSRFERIIAAAIAERDELAACQVGDVARRMAVRGLERARQIADEIEIQTVDFGIERAIAAEIDKAGKPELGEPMSREWGPAMTAEITKAGKP